MGDRNPKIKAEISCDGKQFEAALSKAEKRSEGFASFFKANLASAFTVAAVASFAKSVAEHVGHIKDLADQYNITTTKVQQYMKAASTSGVEATGLLDMLNKIQDQRKAAALGDEKAAKAFQSFGISVDMLQNPMTTADDLLRIMGSYLKSNADDARVMASFMDLLGVKSAKLASALAEIKDSQDGLIDKQTIEKIDEAAKKD